MNIAISKDVHATTDRAFGQSSRFKIVQDRVVLMDVGRESVLFDAVSMIELYQTHYEVLKCLRKTTVRSTYISLLEWKVTLETEIEARISAAQ